MVDWVKKRLSNKVELQKITEELLDELVSKDSGNQYGMDNMSTILIKFNPKWAAWSLSPSIHIKSILQVFFITI